MQPHACSVVSDRGRERFIWATSAAKARALASVATAEPEGTVHEQTQLRDAASSWLPERWGRHEAVAER